MRLWRETLLLFISLGLLSGCAYIQGRKDQQTNPAVSPKPSSGRVIDVQEPTQPLPDTAPNPSETASKILTPLTN
jgi:hypothetical protein